MKAKVLSIKDFLKLNSQEDKFFKEEIYGYSIPKYQREYKWKENMIEDLFNDIEDKAKFLGIIALEEKKSTYEIIDGQQRLTTIVLMLVELFNLFKTDNNINEDQKSLMSYIFNPDLIIKNETIGDYLSIVDISISVSIPFSEDIYRQKDTFEKILSAIHLLFSKKFCIDNDKVDRPKLNRFKRNLLDCNILVFINKSIRENDSTEEIYVDINQKSQHLDVEDIYKGYCFQKTGREHHDTLKTIWGDIKRLSFYFYDNFGVNDLNDLLYYYYLSRMNTRRITQDLTMDKRHILINTTSTDIFEELRSIKSYLEIMKKAYDKVKDNDYIFDDICSDASSFKNTFDYKKMKTMLKGIMSNKKVQYHKLPFFVLIEKLYSENENSIINLDFKKLRKIITNYYIYSVFFIHICKKKSKKNIEYNLIDKINKVDNIENTISIVIDEIKSIRKNVLDSVEVFYENYNKNDKQAAYDLYSVFDNFKKQDQKLEAMYSLEDGYNDEHFLIHQNKKVEWLLDENSKYCIDISKYGEHEKKVINHLILPITLNESLECFDIVEKINKIKFYYTDSDILNLPKHIEFFINSIEFMEEYNELKSLKEQKNVGKNEICEKYNNFLHVYFGDENSLKLRQSLLSEFKKL